MFSRSVPFRSMEMLRHLLTQLCDATGGNSLPFAQEMRKRMHPMNFKCEWNGMQGNSLFLENYFIALLSAFNIEPAMSFLNNERATNVPGVFLLKHYRAFCEWWPTDQTIRVPCTISIATSGQKIMFLQFSGLLKEPLVQAGCPAHIANITTDPRAMNHFGQLVRRGQKMIKAAEVMDYSTLVAHGLDPRDPGCWEKLDALRRRR